MSGRSSTWSHRLVLPDGTMKSIHVVGHQVFNASGDLETYVGTAMDVTERKHAEEVLDALAGRLIQAQEEERSRIGRELHDRNLDQMLGVLTLRIDQLRASGQVSPEVDRMLDDYVWTRPRFPTMCTASRIASIHRRSTTWDSSRRCRSSSPNSPSGMASRSH